MKLKLLLVLLLPAWTGCAATSLQCGVDGDSSYINLNTTPQAVAQTARTLAELCSFNYLGED